MPPNRKADWTLTLNVKTAPWAEPSVEDKWLIAFRHTSAVRGTVRDRNSRVRYLGNGWLAYSGQPVADASRLASEYDHLREEYPLHRWRIIQVHSR